MKKFLATFLFIPAFFLFANTAFAHATPLTYQPDASSILTVLPGEIQIHFSERIESKSSSIEVFSPSGQRVDAGTDSVSASDPRVFTEKLNPYSEPGTFSVSWQVVSADDGHFTKGAFVFSVGKETVIAGSDSGSSFQIVHSSGLVEGLTLGLELLGEATLLGILILCAFVLRPMKKKSFGQISSAAHETIEKRIFYTSVAAVLLVILSTAAYLILKSGELASVQQTAFVQAFKSFTSTIAGRFTFYRLVAVLALWIIFIFSRRKILSSEKTTPQEIVMLLLLALIDLARARVSHAAASHFAPALSVFINFVHLYFKDILSGGIVALLIVFSPLVKQAQNLRLTAYVLTAYSKITSVAFGIAGVAGAYVVWLHLKSLNNIFSTPWGNRFVFLSAVGGALFTARLFHQVIVETLAVRKLQGKQDKIFPAVLSWTKISLPFEMGMGVLLLFVTGLIIITSPPTLSNLSFKEQAVSQGEALTLQEHPYEQGKFLVTVSDPKDKNKNLGIQNLSVTLTNAEKSIGPIVAKAEQRSANSFVFNENLLSPAGNWKIDVVAQRPNSYDADAAFTVKYPDELTQSRLHSEDRKLDGFAAGHVGVALSIIFGAVLLFWYSRKLQREIEAAEYEKTVLPEPVLLYDRGAWGPPAILAVFMFMILGGIGSHGAHSEILANSFQKQCTKDGNMWHISSPEREGKAVSAEAVSGCMVGMGLGQYHFADFEEYKYFTRPAEARVEMKTDPELPQPGKPVKITFSIKDYANNPVTDLNLDHDRLLHAIIISQDFSSFSHIHVEDLGPVTDEMKKKGEYTVQYTFPKDGRFLVAVDFMVRAKAFSEQFFVNVGDVSKAPTSVLEDASAKRVFDGYEVTLKTSDLTAGKPATVSYHIAKDNSPVKNLELYLSMPMHIAVVRDDLQKFMHIHGLPPLTYSQKLSGVTAMEQMMSLPSQTGPDVETTVIFPTPGIYHIYGEFKHEGKVVTTHFMVKVK